MMDLMKYLDKTKPRSLVLENVCGLATKDADSDKSPLDYVMDTLSDMGYHAQAVFLDLQTFHMVVRRRLAVGHSGAVRVQK